MCEQLVELREAMSGYATRFDAALLSASLAERVVETATAIEHMAATVKSLAAAADLDNTQPPLLPSDQPELPARLRWFEDRAVVGTAEISPFRRTRPEISQP